MLNLHNRMSSTGLDISLKAEVVQQLLTEGHPPPIHYRILLVEDSVVLHKAMTRLLKSGGHTVDTAFNGSIALNILTSNRDAYDLVLMDLQMPIMDGYVATKQYREFEATHSLCRLPIIAVSANDMIAVWQACVDAGMDDFLHKPFTLEELSSCLFKLDIFMKV